MPLIDDRFANIITAEVVQSGANVETYVEIATGVSLGQQLGMVIDQIDYHVAAGSLALISGANDRLLMCVSTSDLPADLSDVTDRRILDCTYGEMLVLTSGESPINRFLPVQHMFSPPLIIASPRLFLGVDSANLAGAVTARVRIYFRYVKLTAQEYLEVAETFLITA